MRLKIMSNISITILMPCLNEEETIGICIQKASKFLKDNKINGEIIIADNGSTDKSRDIATNLGANVVNVREKGYGEALYHGINSAKHDFVIMGDADDSYDFSDLGMFIKKFNDGYEFVIGNRFLGGINKGAMPILNRYLGNPALTFIGNFLFNANVGDFHCGLRGIRKDLFHKIDLRTSGMEFASEMVIKSFLADAKIAEIPIVLHKDGRSRPPHLRPWRDGWRHLKFMLVFSPDKVFFYPAMICFFLSLLLISLIFTTAANELLLPIKFGIVSQIISGTLLIFSYLLFISGCFMNVYSKKIDLHLSRSTFMTNFNAPFFELFLLVAVIFLIIATYLFSIIFNFWSVGSYEFLNLNSSKLYIFCMIFSAFISLISFTFSLLISALTLPTRRT